MKIKNVFDLIFSMENLYGLEILFTMGRIP